VIGELEGVASVVGDLEGLASVVGEIEGMKTCGDGDSNILKGLKFYAL
jgi:hypothetical protein